MATSHSLIPIERIEKLILSIRGHRVMLDSNLAELYGVTTKRFNEQVKRNKERFPEDFMSQLTRQEAEILRSQIATSSWGGRRYLPFVFTEHGVIMAANVLNSPRAIQASVQVVRAFVRMRQLLASHKGLMQKILEMEKKYDKQFQVVFAAIRKFMAPEPESKRRIGFHAGGEEE
jgi:hypothetical protein